jgi:coenzyme F420-reducing hydrogenase gamma subunit
MGFLSEFFQKKKRVGVFSFTCCEGCTVSFIETFNSRIEDYMKKMKIVNFRALMPSNKITKMDIALVEGAISTPSELNKLLEIRKKAKKLVALGSGAANGYPSNQRNKFDDEKKRSIQPLIVRFRQFRTIEPLSKYVKVDDVINGCPVDEKEVIKKMEEYLNA